MPTPLWADFFKTYSYAFTNDPLAKTLNTSDVVGAGISQPDSIPTLSPDGSFWSGSDSRLIRLRESNDFIDLSTVTNRQSRYKEYERLRSTPEIEMALNVFSDEACLVGHTLINTPFGYFKIKDLIKKHPDEKFLVYCYDFTKKDFTLGWAHSPRQTKIAKTVVVILRNGKRLECTPDHRVLKRNGEWIHAGELKKGDELMPFYRIEANNFLNKIPVKRYPRIYSHNKGWIHERQILEEYKAGKDLDKYQNVNYYCRLLSSGMKNTQIKATIDCDWRTVQNRMKKEGWNNREIRWLQMNYKDSAKVLAVLPGKEQPVYDITVEEHHNFCTDSLVVHNCQKDSNGNIFTIETKNDDVKQELEFLFFHKSMLNVNRRAWADFKSLLLYGDLFYELVISLDNPGDGILKLTKLPAESMYRIETTKGKVVEFQQSKEGPDYQSLTRAPVIQSTDQEIMQATAIRFAPEQVVHMKIGDDRKTFYPYGVSMVEAARGPAHQLRLMEDSMLVYRLSRSPERRVFYIDVGQLPPFKAEAFVEKMKDQFRKKKISTNRAGMSGPNSVEERYHAPAVDEDYWLPVRPNTSTRIETLPGAQNLGEIDDAVYFRNRVFTAMQFPKNYFNIEDSAVTKITLSAQDVRVARLVERLQAPYEDGMWEIANRHLRLRGYPPESYEDLKLRMTPPSEWRELSRAEITTARITNASSLKSAALISDYDILNKWMQYSESEAKILIGRMKMQKVEDAKLQIMAQNPALLGVGIPSQQESENNQEIGATPEGPNQEISPDMQTNMSQETPPESGEIPTQQPQTATPPVIPKATEEDIEKYDMRIMNYSAEEDIEEVDPTDYE
jgi:hypothetical protein